MLNIFKQLDIDLNEYDVRFIHSKLSEQQLKDFPNLFYPYDEMIQYAAINWKSAIAKDNLIKDLFALKIIMQQKFNIETSELKIGDEVIMRMQNDTLDGFMCKRRLDEVQRLFNPISKEAKAKLNESYKRTH